jgi:hypothetical protein
MLTPRVLLRPSPILKGGVPSPISATMFVSDSSVLYVCVSTVAVCSVMRHDYVTTTSK